MRSDEARCPHQTRRRSSLLRWLLVLLFWGQAIADTGWTSLTPEQQRVLTPFAEEWDSLDEAARERLLLASERWLAAAPEQRREAAERFSRWQALDPARREELGRRYRWFQDLPPERQRELRQTMQRFRHLPPEERQRLQRRFQNMSPDQRQAFLDGVRASRRVEGMERFWQQFSAEERQQLRAIDRSLSEEQRMLLRHRMRNAPPAQRAQLMREWLVMSEGERERWLRPR
jgi:hypothetical protein